MSFQAFTTHQNAQPMLKSETVHTVVTSTNAPKLTQESKLKFGNIRKNSTFVTYDLSHLQSS